MKFDGVDWLPAIDEKSSVMTGATDVTAGAEGLVPQPLAGDEYKFLKGDGSWDAISAVDTLDDLSDVNTTGAASGHVLTFDGTDWSASAPSGGGGGSEITGVIKTYAGSTAPSGYLMCDGTAIDRSTYSNLFAVVGTSFGVGDGSTTFNLPDLRGRVAVGAGQGSGLTNRTLANTFGEENHQLTVTEMASHSHGIAYGWPNNGNYVAGTANNVSSTSTGGSGSNQAHNTMQPSIALNHIIKF